MDYITAMVMPVFLAGLLVLFIVLLLAIILFSLENKKEFIRYR